MKKVIIIALLGLSLVSCDNNQYDLKTKIEIENYNKCRNFNLDRKLYIANMIANDFLKNNNEKEYRNWMDSIQKINDGIAFYRSKNQPTNIEYIVDTSASIK